MVIAAAIVALIGLAILIAIAAFVFWVYMIVDCLKRKKFEDKLVWIVVLVFLHIIGALLYYFIVYREPARK